MKKERDRGNKHVHMHGEMLVKEENSTNFQGVKAIDLDILLIYNKHVHNIARDIYMHYFVGDRITKDSNGKTWKQSIYKKRKDRH
ncbi:MAG: hypothetical protein BWX72_01867 [Firmicutes bacterium ADurb.Bin080]|jgi:hypothetical protein|nr:MAG: hypothetical protein BWX72_01867 [Firmicutes bacterium ADurb.Bin080]